MRACIGMPVQVFKGTIKAGVIVDIVNPVESIVSCVQWDATGSQSMTGNIKFYAADEAKPPDDYCAEVCEQQPGAQPKTKK